MTDTTITVQGEYSAWYPAERATVNAGVHAYGAGRDAVFTRAVTAADTVRNLIEALYDTTAGPITWWSSDSVRVWSERPWNNEGKQLPLVFHAAVDFSAKFKDFESLSRWVEAVAEVPDVSVGSIAWDLTEATKTSATTEVRSRAVKDAIAKATVFAQSVGLGKVTATALADPGMLGNPGAGGESPGAMFATRDMMSVSYDSGMPSLTLKPEQIAVFAAVDARFIAS